MEVTALLGSPKLISRKIFVIEKIMKPSYCVYSVPNVNSAFRIVEKKKEFSAKL